MTTTTKNVPPAETALAVKAIEEALAAPFTLQEVKWKPQATSKEGNRAMVIAFVDARVIQDRLDDVLGVMGWQDSYETFPDGTALCRLRIRLPGTSEWITKEDVGGQSEQPDEGDRRKASISDALKRAAVKFGVGRYLYRLPQQWVDYDSRTKKITGTPRLPDWAIPRDRPGETEPVPAPPRAPKKAAKGKPATGEELAARLGGKDRALAEEGLCEPGELLTHVKGMGMQAGFASDFKPWQGPAIELAIAEVKAFEARARKCPGEALLSSLRRQEAALVGTGQAEAGELIGHVRQRGAEARFPEDTREWSVAEVKVARGWARQFITAADRGTEPDPTSPITEEEARELLALAERKGQTWAEVAKKHGLGSKLPTDLWHAMLLDVTAELERYPDRAAKRKAPAKR